MKHSTKTKVKKWTALLLLTLLAMVFLMIPAMGSAMAETVARPDALAEPLTWEYLATVGGAAVFVLIVVQLTKDMLDKLVKVPTTIYAYILAVITMFLATAFTSGITPSGALLTLFNGWIVAATAAKSYDVMAGV